VIEPAGLEQILSSIRTGLQRAEAISGVFGLVGWVSLIFMVLGTGAATRIFIVGSARGKVVPATATDYATANH
jgi:hypothetical protein